MKVLNLYAGLGGNRKLWEDVGVDAVENDERIAQVYGNLYQQDTVIVGDAHAFLLANYRNYDFIWSSPPCQSHSRMSKFTRHSLKRYPDMGLWQEIILLKEFCKVPWVVENVQPYYGQLIKGTRIGRHVFWSNVPLVGIEPVEPPKDFINRCTVQGKRDMMDWLGIHYDKNIYYTGNHCPAQILRNCVHPLLGKRIFDTLCNPPPTNTTN